MASLNSGIMIARSWLSTVWSRMTTRPRRIRVRQSTCSEPLETRELLTVKFNGGALLEHVEVQALYYGSNWSTAAGQVQADQFDSFLNYLVGSPYIEALFTAGYNVGTGTAAPGVTDPTHLTGRRITDSKLRIAIQTDISSGVLEQPDANRLYVVFAQPGTIVKAGFGNSVRTFLGYHDHFRGHDAQGGNHNIFYAVVPFHGRPNAIDRSAPDQFASMTSTVSHEVAEAITDPVPGEGWYDNDYDGEIADLTDSNVILNGYYVQQFVGQDGKTAVQIPNATSLAQSLSDPGINRHRRHSRK